VLIYGASGFGREVAWLIEILRETGSLYKTRAYIDDDPIKSGGILNECPVVNLASAAQIYPDALVAGGIGNPSTREMLTIKASEAGFDFATLIHPRTELSKRVLIGEGTIICAGNILTTNIHLGKHIHLNLDCTVGHDVVMGDYTTLAPGVHVSGWVHFGERAYVGTGASIVNGTEENPLTIGVGAVIGAGACVTKSIPDGETWAGVPAKRIH